MVTPADEGRMLVFALRLFFYFGLAWCVLFYRRWNKRRKETNAQSWPTVQARIWSGLVAPIPKTNRFLATLTYNYFVEEYRYGKYTHEFAREAEADEFVRQMKDKQVLIRYKESKPDVSVLEQSIVEQTVALSPIRN